MTPRSAEEIAREVLDSPAPEHWECRRTFISALEKAIAAAIEKDRAETIERCALPREIDMTGFARPDNTSICDWREVSCHHCGGNGIVAAYSRNEAVHA